MYIITSGDVKVLCNDGAFYADPVATMKFDPNIDLVWFNDEATADAFFDVTEYNAFTRAVPLNSVECLKDLETAPAPVVAPAERETGWAVMNGFLPFTEFGFQLPNSAYKDKVLWFVLGAHADALANSIGGNCSAVRLYKDTLEPVERSAPTS